MTAVDYIKGLFTYSFSDTNIASVFLKRGLDITAQYEDATTEQLELIQADLYMVMYTVFSQGAQSKKSGGWSSSDGGYQVGVYDRRAFKRSADDIYKKYGEYTSYSLKDGTYKW